ncbi:MAG: long-chain-fatty-acid--CoA ligase [Desulfobacteraceae bacterium]|nr:long-chain-fatty-acid--CoA ligase [Desulfobacteraceae bacterium]
MNMLAYMISRASKYYGGETAVVHENRRSTFIDIEARSNKLARAFVRFGIEKGDRVAVYLPNCTEYIETDFALIKSGVVRLPLNVRLTAAELCYIVNDAEANTLVFSDQLIEKIKDIRDQLSTVKNFIVIGDCNSDFALPYESVFVEQSSDEFSIDVADNDPYQILYTSGTTGKPKGALTSFGNRIAAVSTTLIDEMKIERCDALLTVAPMAHGGGTKIYPHFIKGAKNVLLSKFSVQSFCETVELEKITTTWMVPTMITTILDYPELKNYDLSSLKTVVYAAAPMPMATLKQALKTFGQIFVQVYGLTEVPNPDLLLPKADHILDGDEEQLQRLSSAGRGVFGVRVRVVDEKGNDVAPGQVGEIILSGDNVMLGYWKKPDATSEAIKDGWFYTGDMATVDTKGYVYIVDRRKDMIISGGLNVYPREVEDVLCNNPAVSEATVIGVPDEKWGEAVKAIVVLRKRSMATEEDIILFCKEYLSNYKIPKSVEIVDEIPKNPYGKVLKREIRKKYWKGRDRAIN